MKQKKTSNGYVLPVTIGILAVVSIAFIFILSRINSGTETPESGVSASSAASSSEVWASSAAETSSVGQSGVGSGGISVPAVSSDTGTGTSSFVSQPETDGGKYLNFSFADPDRLDDYIVYHRKNPEISAEQAVVNVNIGLDREFYTDIKPAENVNGILVLVNKFYFLGADYEPDDLVVLDDECRVPDNGNVRMRKAAADALLELSRAARAEGFTVYGCSGYRTYSRQDTIYTSYVKREGRTEADLNVARPGHSEHQTGLAVDVCADAHSDYGNFGNTRSYGWVRDNAHKFGFIIHYTDDNVGITGYISEPWHLRYVGKKAAEEIYESGMSFEEYCARGLAN